jgi:hypothetical protein
MENEWTPPSDGVASGSSFVPPSDAVKKKDLTASGSGTSSSGRLSNTTTKPTASSSSKGEIFTGYPGKEEKPYQFKDGKWYEEAPVKVYGQKAQYVQIQDPNRIGNLNKQFKKDASLSQEYELFNNYDDEKADNQYRIKDGQWQRMTPGSKWHTIQNEGSINALNNRYGKSVSSRVVTTTTMKPAKFDDINSDFVAKTEENAIKYLTEKYGKYGFEFSEEGAFAIDQIKVKTKDGSKEKVFEFDEKNPEQARELRAFLEVNATKSYSENFDKALNSLNKFEGKDQMSGPKMGTGQYGYQQQSAIIRGKNLLSSEFQSEFKKLPFEEQKEIIQEQIIGTGLPTNDVQSFYKSAAYQDYKKKKVGGDQQSKSKQDQIYDDYQYALATKDPAKIKEAKAKIDAYYTDDIIQDNVKTYNMKLNDLEQSQKNILQDRKAYDDEVSRFNELAQSGKMTQEQYDAQKKILDNQAESLETRAQNFVMQKKEIQASQNKLNLVAGKYVAAKEKEGNLGGFLVNKVLTGVSMAFVEPFAALEASAEKRYDQLSPEEKAYYKSIKYNGKNLTKDQIENLLDNQAMLKAKNEAKESIIKTLGAEGTTLEYMKSGDRGFITQAIGGVLESLPAMATGIAGKAAGFTGLALQAYSGIEEEMLSDPDFQYTSAGDRAIIAIPYAAGMGVLENVGLQNLVKGDSFLGKVMMDVAIKSAKKVGANATKEALERVAAKEVESLLAKGLIRVTQAGVAEFETGFTQALVLDQGLKQAYNWIQQSGMTEEQKKKLTQGEYFDTADTLKELGSKTFEDGVAEMIGGFTMGSVGTVLQAVVNGNISLYNEDDVKFLKDVVADSNFKKLYVASMKTQMLDGKITKSKAQQNLNNLNEIEAAFDMMPNGLSTADMNTSLSLITERAQLTREKAGKDPNLVAPLEARIKAINEELTKIGENAVQEQTTSEIPVQPEARVGGEVAQGKPEAGPQEVTQEGGQAQEIVQSEERQSLIDAYVQEETNVINETYVGVPQEEKQAALDKLAADPISYAREKEGMPRADRFINSLEQAPAVQEVGYRSGDLVNKAETKGKFEGGDRSTGHFGTGFYFFGTKDKADQYDGRNTNPIDLSGYNLAKGTIELHDALKDINNLSIGRNKNEQDLKYKIESLLNYLGKSEVLPIGRNSSDQELEAYTKSVTEQDQKIQSIISEINKSDVDSPSTVVMKALGFDGIDSRGTELDNAQYGSVIYSLKDENIAKDNQKETNFVQNEKGNIQSERTGDGRTARPAISKNAPLEGAPTIQGATGPDPGLVSVAEKYADENDIDLKRQGEYVELDEQRAKRIADAYEQMADDPQNPKVKEAYAELIKQTKAQYQALIDAGYKFWFIDVKNPENIDYISSPYNAMRDLRQNKQMGVFPTEQGFGSNEDMDVSKNPLLEDTGIMWPSGGLDGEMKIVTANDLFRAVHDTFGHGLEGAGFRARGEENAWQAHSRLYTGSAIGAMTSETRGQNSWVNYGPKGEQNRTASGEDTIFADQKVGLMPEWTWTEGRAGDMEEDILQADTKDATNLQKALDALDKIEKDLDQFGKETLGVNIPVALAKTIVKAVKALVQAGVTLEQAIKQIAAEYNLSDRDVKSLLTPTKVSEIDVNEVRAKARPGKRISKGLSVKTVDRKKVIEETEDLSIEYVKKNAPKAFVSNANIIAKYPLVAGKKKFKTATTVEQAQEIYDVFVREVADNLNYLMAEFKPEYREISTLWYDGANAIANDFAAQFGVSAEQAAGIIAAMSPQKDWYQNVRLAEMVLMAYKDNPVMTKEMVDYQKGVNKKGLYDGAKSAGKKLKLAQKEYSESRTKANKEALEEAKVKLQEAIEKADAVITMLNKYIGKNLNDVPAAVQPYMVRTYHEVNTTKDYNIVAPDGSVQGVAKKNNGAKAKVAWGSYSEIGKAVAIKNDGSQENITRSLGEMHKIRNFYNNIIDPMSNDGDVTMDTHAIAAALLLPLSGKSTQVGQNFGTKTANSAPLGIKGLYYAYADAYALAAKEAGLLPRQVQSITWEAVRGLYTDTFKGNKAQVAKINNIWKDYQDGKITIDEAREQAKESAGGIKDPTWAGPVQTESGDGAGAQGVEGRGDGNERDTVGGTDGGGILTADTKNPTVLKRVENALNKADDDLAKFGRETLGINIPVATMRAIIKLAKVLVKTGITLQDAIIQAAEQKNVSKKDALNAIKFMVETINKPVEKVTVNKVTALKDQIRLEARAAREGAKSVSQAVKAITAFFKDKANQVNLTRAELKSVINIISSVKDQKTLDAAADKIYKIVSSAKSDVIEVNQMQALKSQIRLEAKAAREAKGDLNSKRKALAAAITGMVRQGKITAVQARSIINKVSRVNLDNPVMVDRLISYAERVFDRADYQETLSKAAKIRKSIKKAMKSKDLQAEVAGMAKKFSGVDPFMVEDIDQYIENAEKVLNAVRPVRETEVPLRQAADIEAISEYTTAQVERQEANKKAELLALNKYLVEAGIITDDMTAKEIQEMIDIIAAEEYEVENADKKLNFLKNRFDFMAGVIEEMIVNNKDIFTDEALDLTQNQRDLMREVLKFDIDKLSVKQAAQVLEAMDNFINNGITSGLEAVVKGYIGNDNANKLAASGLKSRPLKMYWNKAVGRFFGEQFVSLPLLIERMFPGMKKGLKLMSEMGLTDVIRGASKADREHKMIAKDYTSQEFYKGKGFMKAENVYERGMIAFLSRNLAGTKTEMRNEFLRRIKMVEESINALMNGSETERKMGEAYQQVFDKLKVNSQDLDVIKANAEQMNIDAVNWMTQQWAEKYSDLSDISLSVYNAILGSDTSYTPDRYKGLDESDIELDENLLQKGSAFMAGLEYTDKNKSGVLIETTRPKALPKGRFVSLDFDVNNFSSLKGAMIDIETAPAIRQVDGFIKSDGYKKIVNGDDRKILTRRINNYIIAVKGKTAFNRDSMRSVERVANFLGSLGVGKALGGFDQTIKQTAPVIINTLINAGRFDGLNLEMNAAINRSGMPIANRGIEAISGVESVDALIDKKGATAAEIGKAIEKVSQMYMKALLSKPDVWVARSSFISYYKNYLKTNGMSTDIDWQTHEWNQEAMNYAQMMVDRQQNISDEKLAGSFMNSPDPWKSVTRKVILPFATFIINQKNRMHNDLIALFGVGAETSSEDKKKAARSLVGLSAEMLAYQSIAYFIKTMVYDQLAAYITGEDDEEEKKERSFLGIKMTKKEWNATKFPVKSLVSDVISPFPLFDDAVVFGFDELMSNFPMISKEDIDKAIQDQNDARALKGQDPMDAEQEANLIKNLKDKNTYAVTFQKESLGRQYGVPGIAFDTYTELADMAQLAYTGEFEDDMGFGPKKKYISKKDQELVKWTLLPMVLYSTGLVPKDAGVVSRKVVATVKKRSISETKFKNTSELKTELGRKPKDWEESLVMNTTKKVPTLVEAIKFAERFGGLTESQGKEYAKLIELTGDYGYLDLKRIQDGETADQILKK